MTRCGQIKNRLLLLGMDPVVLPLSKPKAAMKSRGEFACARLMISHSSGEPSVAAVQPTQSVDPKVDGCRSRGHTEPVATLILQRESGMPAGHPEKLIRRRLGGVVCLDYIELHRWTDQFDFGRTRFVAAKLRPRTSHDPRLRIALPR